MKYIIIALTLVTLVACQHSHDHGAHSTEEQPSVDYTIWTDKTELFVEFAPLVVGQPSEFAAHFTVLQKHQAVKSGTLTISLVSGTDSLKVVANKPLREGIFLPTVTPTKAGVFQLVFDVNSPQLTDRVIIDSIRVYADKKAVGTQQEGAEPEISFLKEQAWKIEFQTQKAVEQEVFAVIPSSGTWKTASSDIKTLVANTHGKVDFKISSLVQGTKVKKGQILINLSAEGFTENNHEVEIRNAKTNLKQAKAEFERNEKLVQLKIVPLAEFEKVKQKYTLALSNFKKLTEGYDEHHGKSIAAPFDGYIQHVFVSNGEFLDEGTSLMQIVAKKTGLLEVQVGQTYVDQLENIENIYYQPRPGVWSNLKATKGNVLSVSNAVSANSPMVSVFAEVNDAVQFPEGAYTETQIIVGTAKKGIVIPSSALLENYGQYSVIVQVSGEGFEKRDIQIGARFGDFVEVTKGLQINEMIVSKGGYQVKMASMSGTVPAHHH